MSAKHTIAPWQAVCSFGQWNVTTTGKPRTFNVCSVNDNRDEREANAYLLAAAPELLLELQALVEIICGRERDVTVEDCDCAKAAIIKAGGSL